MEQAAVLVACLARAGVGDVDDSSLTRSLYSNDASLYRVPPLLVVRPRDADEVVATMAACREVGVPVTARGAGTSIAGNAIGPGAVIDFAKYMHAVESVDVEASVAHVQAGVVHASLQRVASPLGLRFGPDPSSHNRCTVGGMIGNNACGSRALAYGRTSDNVVALDCITSSGERLHLGTGAPESATLANLRDVVSGGLRTIRTEFGQFGRQISGYSLEHLLPERGFDVAKAMVGSEGTLAVVVRATVRLVADAPYRALVVLGYSSMAEAADDVPAVLGFGPTACEGLDDRIVDVVRRRHGGGALPALPPGNGWLFVEVVGESAAEVVSIGSALAAGATSRSHRVVTDPTQMAALWRIREDGGGLAAGALDRPARSGWEDAAVPPEHLGSYLRAFDALLQEFGLNGVPYGHFGDGCVHVRIDFPLEDGRGVGVFRAFVLEAAKLVTSFGGSLSGEHGDGRSRSALLPLMYSDDALALFAAVKNVFDPDGVLNPGVLVEPNRVDADLRLTARASVRQGLALRLAADRGDLSAAVHRCTGVGKCLADSAFEGGVMCPSYAATRNEKDSTRGRARVLQDMVAGGFDTGGPSWRAAEVHEALDLCLACKACARECPTGVDMAAYKAEVLHNTYRGRLRPRSHYALGWLPRWARLAARAPTLVNVSLSSPVTARWARQVAGVDQRRPLPRFASETFRGWAARRSVVVDGRPRVVVWADTFTNFFSPEVGRAAVEVLERAGYRVEVPRSALCCGLTWISTGQLDAARRILGRTVSELAEYVRDGVPIVGLEPSCTAVLRSDAVELLADPSAEEVTRGVFTLAELLTQTDGWTPPDLSGVDVVAQPHCHHASVLGWDADAALLVQTGARLTRVGGCCGLAGNFGVEKGHHDVSVAIAEQNLLPALKDAGAGTIALADGFSCRTQLEHLADRRGWHLAELLAAPSIGQLGG